MTLDYYEETNDFLSQNFEMKDMGDTSYVIGMEIFRDRSQDLRLVSECL